jgi:hypothetical protein
MRLDLRPLPLSVRSRLARSFKGVNVMMFKGALDDIRTYFSHAAIWVKLTGTLRLRQTQHDSRYRINAAFALAVGERGFLVRCLIFFPSNVVNSVLAWAVADEGLSSPLKDTRDDRSVTPSYVEVDTEGVYLLEDVRDVMDWAVTGLRREPP